VAHLVVVRVPQLSWMTTSTPRVSQLMAHTTIYQQADGLQAEIFYKALSVYQRSGVQIRLYLLVLNLK
jgi:hypothetical protein